MYSIINGDDTQKMSMGHQPSLSGEEANDAGENNFGGEGPLKKGPWTAAEDAILVEYVKKHGEGNWNAVQKHSGLARCGKSCRLRWANHLRPDLKKGAFTREEERKIIELHAKWGNKWARMAAELPGRTDNEIKNYWNTRIKRMERAGLPLYPPDICIQESSNASGLMNGASQQSDLLQPENFEIPDLDFKNFKHNQGYVSYVPAIFDIPERNTFELSAGSSNSYNKIMFPTIPPSEQFCESGMPYNTVESGIGRSVPVLSSEYLGYAFEEDAEPLEYADYPNEIAELPQYVGYACEEIAEPSKLSSSCGPNHNTSDQFQVDNFPGSHAVINGNTSSSVPISVAMKELPSLQYVETQQCSWGALVSPLHSLDSVDKFIESPPVVETLSGPTPEQISGLLEAVVYESKNIENSLQQTPDNFLHRSSTLKPIEAELNEQEDPHCTVGQSAESVHHEFTPSRYSLDDPKSVGTSKDHDIKHEIVTRDPTYYFKTKQNLNEIDLTRPDVLLDCGWFQNDSKYSNDRYLLQDAIDALRGEEIHDDH